MAKYQATIKPSYGFQGADNIPPTIEPETFDFEAVTFDCAVQIAKLIAHGVSHRPRGRTAEIIALRKVHP